MKTCPNPKCKTSSIPNDAKYCPVCGAQLKSLSTKSQASDTTHVKLVHSVKFSVGEAIAAGIVFCVIIALIFFYIVNICFLISIAIGVAFGILIALSLYYDWF